ncbi:hypothetical protein ABT127_30025 [Streptomyces sp. NPDC001904]|uniref:hypothetical protein n=1 Tax=Streptomyces sp. NPDC001904 TaxID=3154531 RepID=UPI00332F5E28
MTTTTSTIEEILARALLVRDRHVPADIVPTTTPLPDPDHGPGERPGPAHGARPEAAEADQDLRTLCETVVSRTTAEEVVDFVTEDLPGPRGALVLACVLQLTDTDDGARFWWQYAAGAGQSAAAYCLYLHHRSAGEDVLARWWQQQTDAIATPAHTDNYPCAADDQDEWSPANHRLSGAAPTTVLRVLRHLAGRRTRSLAVTRLMDYLPTAVGVGYLRHDFEIPLPGEDFARQITDLVLDELHSGSPAQAPPPRSDEGPVRNPATSREIAAPSSSRSGGESAEPTGSWLPRRPRGTSDPAGRNPPTPDQPGDTAVHAAG